MTRSTLMAAAAAAALLAAGCGSSAYQWPGDAKPAYSAAIHVYPGATLESAMGGDYYGDEGHMSETLTWWFKCSDAQEKIADWYATQLPKAERSRDDDGNMVFTYAPLGGEAGEEIVVRVGQKEFRITEETKPGKHKES